MNVYKPPISRQLARGVCVNIDPPLGIARSAFCSNSEFQMCLMTDDRRSEKGWSRDAASGVPTIPFAVLHFQRHG